ncbi:MAG TPA: pyridoxamine 5'-phosphate oxidase family protein [Phycisphaerales bacterium]|nr:pyridoxamine 5'-phosphate oxidase family protein [Phycisphaerales bacterium]
MVTQNDAAKSDAQRLAELIREVRVAMFTTFAPGSVGGSAPHARPMYTHNVKPEDFDGVLWFMTPTGTPKLRELAANQQVLVTYADAGKNVFVSVMGRATAEQNPEKAKELWNIHAKGWYPGGPDDPNLTLIRVEVEEAEYWEGPSNTSYMLKLLKAVATNTRINLPVSGVDHARMKIG